MPDFEVRRARADELVAVGALTVRAYADFLLGPDDPYRARLADAAAREKDAELWVAADATGLLDTGLLGTVTVCPPGSPWRELASDEEGEFRMLAVHPDARGRGVGTRLAAHAEERAREAGARAMVLSSLVQMSDAHRVYRRLGYARAPGRDWAPAPGVQLIAFDKPL